MPATVAAEIASEDLSPEILENAAADLEMIHMFVTVRSDLARNLAQARRVLAQGGRPTPFVCGVCAIRNRLYVESIVHAEVMAVADTASFTIQRLHRRIF